MPISPVITFKAGMCELDDTASPPKVHPQPAPGFLYLYVEEEIPHFCWRARSASLDDPTMDLFMPPGDGSFAPYNRKPSRAASEPVTNGRIYVLKFSSSSTRHLFWLQSKSQHPSGNLSWFSPRDLKIGELVNRILQGEDVNVHQELSNLPSTGGGDGPSGDDDTAMEDADGSPDLYQAASGGAGADATGGDVRDEGEESREGGADGARAATSAQSETQAAVANFLKSLEGGKVPAGQQGAEEKVFTTLPDLLQPSATLPILDDADDSYLDSLLSTLPPTLILLASGDEEAAPANPDPETVEAVMMSLSPEQKKETITKVLRSPQFVQSLGSLTAALRDGGLPMISDALKVKVANGGYVRGGNVPLGGGDAVEAFLDGFKKAAEENTGKQDESMNTD